MLRKAQQEQDASWNFNGSDVNRSALKPLCQRVESYFKLPSKRLYRYFAVKDDTYLAGVMGRHFRGFHIPLAGRNDLPDYLRDCFFVPFEKFDQSMTFEQMVAFDNLIYIRRETCSDTIGCVITYAHELQHFTQHGYTPRLWAVNTALYNDLEAFDATAAPIDIPHEREANIIAKRVAEEILGVEAVRKYAEEQIKLMEAADEPAQAARWKFFRDVPSFTKYDLLAATVPFVEKYKGRIDFRVDVSHPEWWIGPLPNLDGAASLMKPNEQRRALIEEQCFRPEKTAGPRRQD